MTAFELRAATKDLQQQSEVEIQTEKGEILEIVNVEHDCPRDTKTNEVFNCYPMKLVITVKGPLIEIKEKIAGKKSEDWRSGA